MIVKQAPQLLRREPTAFERGLHCTLYTSDRTTYRTQFYDKLEYREGTREGAYIGSEQQSLTACIGLQLVLDLYVLTQA